MNIAIILASGIGKRMQNETPKQFIVVKDKPIFLYSVLTFQDVPEIEGIIIVTNREYITTVKEYVKKYNVSKVFSVVSGGKTRQESVRCGLCEVTGHGTHFNKILIHDSARPLVSKDIIINNIKELDNCPAVETALKTRDTIIESIDNKTINQVLNREKIYQAQTPQSFIYNVIRAAHAKAIEDEIEDASDDIGLVLRMNQKVHIVEGDPLNFKITTQSDLMIFKAIVENED